MSALNEILIFTAINDWEMAQDLGTNRIEEYVMKNHPYKMPELTSVDASFGSEKFREFCRNRK
jgi:uncharacterized protein involved in tolerance to divalent cations